MEDTKENSFETTFEKGFHMTFANGWTISVQWGKYNYSDEGETTAEIAAWQDETWFDWEEDKPIDNGTSVKGEVSADEVVNAMVKIKALDIA